MADDTINKLNNTNLSKYGIKSTKISYDSNAYDKIYKDFTKSESNFELGFVPNSGVDQTKVNLAEVTGDGFRLREVNFPRPPWDEPNDVSQKNTPTVAPQSRGWIHKAAIGNANIDLSFSCNFVAPLNLQSCLFSLQLIWKSQIERIQKYVLYIARRSIPILDLILQLKDMFCRILKTIAKYICWIKTLITCVLSTIQAIVQIVTWLVTLPVRFLVMLISCVNSFLANILNSLSNLLNIFGLSAIGLLCEGAFNCPDGSSALDYNLS